MWLFLGLPVLLASTILAQNIPDPIPTATFFISLSTRCQFGGVSLDPGPSFREGGSLCAYVEEANLLYSCPAGDGTCWNTGGQCTGGSNTLPGLDQIACSDIGAGNVNWCCNRNYGNCTQTTFQQNNCWSWFPNPNRGINSLAAAASASAAMQIALTQPSLTNIIVTTNAAGGWSASAAEATTSAFSSTSTASSLSSSSTPSASAAPSSTTSGGSISGGAIAGIAIGAAALGLIGASLGFWFWNRRQRRRDEDDPKELANMTYIFDQHGHQKEAYEKSTSPLLESRYHMAPAELSGSPAVGELSSARHSHF